MASDLLVEASETSIVAEITELLSTEHLLAERAVTPEESQRIVEVVTRFEREWRPPWRGPSPEPADAGQHR